MQCLSSSEERPAFQRSGAERGLRSRLQRITTSTSYIAEIDGLRFLAIFAVILYHIPIALRYAPLPAFAKPWSLSGQLGVQLFFVVSGTVLALPFARAALRNGKPVSVKHYFLRRLTRIEPPYLVCLLLMYGFRQVFARGWIPVAHLLLGMLYLHNLVFRYSNPIDPVMWTLEIEIQFYLLVPLLSYVFAMPLPWRRICLISCIVLSLAGNAASDSLLHSRAYLLEWTILGYLHYFFFGFLFADLFVSRQLGHIGHLWDWMLLLSLPVIVYGHRNPVSAIGETTSACGIGVIFIAAFLGRWTNAFLRLTWIPVIGGMCYSIYLIHIFILQSIGVYAGHHPSLEHGGALDYALVTLAALPVVLIVSGLFFVAIERPCMDPQWPRKLVLTLRRILNPPPALPEPVEETPEAGVDTRGAA